MITMEAEITGGQIARALLRDPEEMAYFLTELSHNKTIGFAEEVAEFAMTDLDEIVVTLREMATAMELEAQADGQVVRSAFEAEHLSGDDIIKECTEALNDD